MSERYLVTGAYGCIGAWVARELLSEGHDVVTYDLGDDPYRLRLVMPQDELDRVTRVHGDITDLAAIERSLDEHDVTHVIHLAALQVPFCQADPSRGAHVNVVGTINVLEAVRRRLDRITAPLVYASSIAVYGTRSDSIPREPALSGPPSTLYGVYKRANESSALVYWQDAGVSSIGLRPHTVYGPGRDQGVTSSPTAAMLAAAAGRAFEIPYGGTTQLQHAQDVARAFVRASRIPEYEGASTHNLAGHAVRMQEAVSAIRAAAPDAAGGITFVDRPLPFPGQVDASSLQSLLGDLPDRSLMDGVRDTVGDFQALLAAGLVSAGDGDPRDA